MKETHRVHKGPLDVFLCLSLRTDKPIKISRFLLRQVLAVLPSPRFHNVYVRISISSEAVAGQQRS